MWFRRCRTDDMETWPDERAWWRLLFRIVGEAGPGEHEPGGVEIGEYGDGGEVLCRELLPLPPSVSLVYPSPGVSSPPRCGDNFSLPHTGIASLIHKRLTLYSRHCPLQLGMTTEDLFGTACHLMWPTAMTPASYLIHFNATQASGLIQYCVLCTNCMNRCILERSRLPAHPCGKSPNLLNRFRLHWFMSACTIGSCAVLNFLFTPSTLHKTQMKF